MPHTPYYSQGKHASRLTIPKTTPTVSTDFNYVDILGTDGLDWKGWVILRFVRPAMELQNKDNQGIRGGRVGSRPKLSDA